AGSISADALGRLVTQDGAFLQGWQGGADGTVNTNGATGNVVIPVGDIIAPVQSENVRLGGNLPSDAEIGAMIANSESVYDAQGNAVTVRFEFTKTAADSWDAVYRFVDENGVAQPTPPAAGNALT